MTADDRDLRDRFAVLRRQEEAQAPGFAVRPASSRPRVRPRSLAAVGAAAACMLTIAIASLWLRMALHRPRPEPGKPVASISDWKPTTDFLLQTPGRELLQTVPAIGAFDDGLSAATPTAKSHRKNRPAGKPISP